MKKRRWPLVLLLLVLGAIIILVALVLLDGVVDDYYHQKHFIKPRVIEKITGVSMPTYSVVNYSCRRTHGPHFYNTTLEFDDVQKDDFYCQLKEKGVWYIDENDSLATISFNKPYKYPLLFGYYGFWTKGNAYIEFREGSKTFKVELFEWPSLE